MAYILPINFYQYKQYQDRIENRKIHDQPTPDIEKVKKAYLSPIKYEMKMNHPFKKSIRKRTEHAADRVYAQLTGIGRNINESI